MEDKKQELIKLIENLDWDKFTDVGCSGLSLYAYTVTLFCDNQKEKIIEQKLEELGFNADFTYGYLNIHRFGLYYFVHAEFKQIDLTYNPQNLSSKDNYSPGYRGTFYLKDENKILSFANYLIKLKNGTTE